MSPDVREWKRDVPREISHRCAMYLSWYLYWDNSTGWLVLFLGSQMPDLRRSTIGRLFFSIIPLERLCGTLFYGGGICTSFLFHLTPLVPWSLLIRFPVISRIMRVFRVFRFFRQLANWAMMILDSLKSLFGALILLGISLKKLQQIQENHPRWLVPYIMGILILYNGYHSGGMENPKFCWEREPAELYESVVHPGLNFQTPMISKEGKIINPMLCFWIDGSRCSSCLVQKKGIIIYVFAVSLSMNTADWLTLQDRYCWCNIGWKWGEKIEVRRNANSSSVNA